MDVLNYEDGIFNFRVILFLLGVVFWFARFVISRLQKHAEGIARIEGRCTEREKAVYKEAAAEETEKTADTGSKNS